MQKMNYPAEFEFVKSNKGQDKLILDNFVYTLQTKKYMYRSWRCEKRRNCKARVDFNGKNGKVKRGLWNHTHEADPIRVETLKLKAAMKDLAGLDQTADADWIFKKAIENSSPEVIQNLSAEVCKRNINRFKQCTLSKSAAESLDRENDVEILPTLENSRVQTEGPENKNAHSDFPSNENRVQIKVEPDPEEFEILNEKLPSFLKSQKGKKKLTWKGYVYNLDKKKPGKHFWKCEKRRLCGGRVICSEGEVVMSKLHTHDPDIARIKYLKIREKIRVEALSAEDPKINSNKIMENVMKEVSLDISNLISTEKMRNTIRYCRKKYLSNPSSDLANTEEKSDDEVQFRLPETPQTPKRAINKAKLDTGPTVTPKRRGRRKATANKENQLNIRNVDDIVESIEHADGDETIEESANLGNQENVLQNLSEKLRNRLKEDFRPKLKDLRNTVIQQVGQMMLDFEENFFSYLLSVTEDSATLLTDRYESPAISENEPESDENYSEHSEGDCDSSDEEVIKDENEQDSEFDVNGTGSDDDDVDYGHINPSANKKGKTGKKRSLKASKNPRINSKSLSTSTLKMPVRFKSNIDRPGTRKRRPTQTFDYDSTDEVSIPGKRAPLKSRKYALRSATSVSFNTEISSPKKKRKTKGLPITPTMIQERNESSTVLNSVGDDPILTTTFDADSTLPPILHPEDIKVENCENNEPPDLDPSETLGEAISTLSSISYCTDDAQNSTVVSTNEESYLTETIKALQK